jgi:hypothetical protein
MWIGLALIALLVVLAIAGITGIGVYDSRDTRFSMRPTADIPSDRLYEHLVAPGRYWPRLPAR